MKNKKDFWRKTYPLIITTIFLAFSIILIYHHELWVDEVRAWHIGSESSSISELISKMRANEGHPYLWNVILYFISHFIIDNIESIKVIHLSISTISAFLFLKYAPFNKIIKAMFVFGYFFFYEYSIISRNYALGVLFIIIFCILYKNKYKNLIPISIALFFMGQFNIFSFIISMALFAFVLLELIRDWKDIREDISKVNLTIAVLVIIAEVLIIYYQLGSQLNGYSDSSIFSIISNPISGYSGGAFRISRGIIGAYIPIPNINLNFFNTNFLVDTIFKGNYLYTFLVSSILFIIPLFLIKRKIIFFYLAGSLGVMSIPFYIYKCSFRHFGHFFLIFIACLWISNINEDGDYLIKYKNDFYKKFWNIFLIIILLFSIIGSSIAFYFDYRYPFSSGKYVAQYIEKNFDKENMVIVGYQDYAAETVSAYLDKDIYSPQSKEFQRLVGWPVRIAEMSIQEVFDEASCFIGENDTVLVIVSNKPVEESEIFEKYFFKKLDTEFNKSILAIENSYLYLFDKNSILDSFELMHRINSSNFGEFWKVLGQCELKEKDNDVWIKVYGEDPHFESLFPIEFKNNNPIMIIVSIESFVEAELQVYYGREGKCYNEEDSDIFTIIKGKNNIYIKIPYSEDLERVRIDPINVKSDCFIKKIEIYGLED